MHLRAIATSLTLIASPSLAQQRHAPPLPPAIGRAYGHLGQAMRAHDVAGLKSVWAEDFIVNAPNNEVLRREEVISAVKDDLLEYRDFKKRITFVSDKQGAVVVMGVDTMIARYGPGAGKQVIRPFTDIWMKRFGRWMLVARQATIAAVSATPAD